MLPHASLIVVASPPDEMPIGNRFSLPAKATLIGRHDSTMGVNITLLDHGVARIHACIWPVEDRWMIGDYWTRIGTQLNGRRVTDDVNMPSAMPLADGDVITIRSYEYGYQFLFATELFDRRWLSSDVVPLARGILDEGAWDRLGILGDALMDSGCDWQPLLKTCSAAGNLMIGRWALLYLLREAGEFDPIPSPLVEDVNEAARPERFGPLGTEVLLQPGRV